MFGLACIRCAISFEKKRTSQIERKKRSSLERANGSAVLFIARCAPLVETRLALPTRKTTWKLEGSSEGSNHAYEDARQSERRAPRSARGVRMSAPGAEARGEAASADAADAADARAPVDAGPPPMALETPETSSDARRAVAPAADASWRAGFHRGYAHGGYARAGADLLRALASASAYVPAPATGSDPGRESARRAPSHAAFPARDRDLDAPPMSTPREDPPLGHDVERAPRYESSVSHSEAWASALLEATWSQTTTLHREKSRLSMKEAPRRKRRRETVADAAKTPNAMKARNSHAFLEHPTVNGVLSLSDDGTDKKACAFALTRVQARRALSERNVLAALARGAFADAAEISSFFFDEDERSLCPFEKTLKDETKRMDGDFVSFRGVRRVDDACDTSIVLGYQSESLAVNPELLEENPLNFYTAAPFAPVGGRGKDVYFCVVAPIGNSEIAACETASTIEAQYQAMRLGTMEPLLSGDNETQRHVFSYDPEKEASFFDALKRVINSVKDATRPQGPVLAYVVAGSESGGAVFNLATYAATRVSEMDQDVVVDFSIVPYEQLGRRRCSPAFAREKAGSAFAVAARRERVFSLGKEKRTSEDENVDTATTKTTPKEMVLNYGDAFGVSKKEPSSLAAFEPLLTIRRRLLPGSVSDRSPAESHSHGESDVRRSMSATLCAYAFSSSREDFVGASLEKDREIGVRSRWLVATWTDDAGETFAVEARATDRSRTDKTEELAELADWLVGRTRTFAAARAAAGGHPVTQKEELLSCVSRETNDGDEKDARRRRAAERARAFFGAFDCDDGDAATFFSDSPAIGAGVVVVEVVPGVAGARGDRAFATALASALAQEKEGDARREETSISESDPSVVRRDDKFKRVLVGETRVVVVADEDETFARDSSDVRMGNQYAPFASIGADGAAATATRGSRLAIATRVGDARDLERTADDSSRVAFAFAALARASRVVRGVVADGRSRASVRDLVPPHVAACASLAATLRDLERIAAGYDS